MDGTVSVTDANGVVDVRGYGAVLGTIVEGRLMIVAPPGAANVTGATVTRQSAAGVRYSGVGMSFRLLGSSAPGAPAFRIRAAGSGISLSFGGRGWVTVTGSATGNDGEYSVNGDAETAITSTAVTLSVGSSGASTASPGGTRRHSSVGMHNEVHSEQRNTR